MRARLLYLVAFACLTFACGVPTAPQGTDACYWALGERSAQSGSQYACEVPGPDLVVRESAQAAPQATQVPEASVAPRPERKRHHKTRPTPTMFPNDCPEGWPQSGTVQQ